MDIAEAGVAAPAGVDDLKLRTRCAACDSPDLHDLLSLGEHPPTNVYPATAEASLALPRWPLELAICQRCTLLQTRLVPPDDVLFGQGYGFRTGHASAGHMANLAGWVTGRFGAKSQDRAGLAVDVGCNDGTLLAAFRDLGWVTLGVDPAGDATAEAQARGIAVITARLTPALAEEIVVDRRRYPLVVTATNVLAHVDDLHELLAGLAILLGKDGRLVAEMQYAPDMLLSNAFDTIYHEHRYIWSLYALERALNQHGLGLLDAIPIPQHGGSVRIVAGKSGTPHPRVEDLIDGERSYGGPAGWAHGTAARAARFETQLRELARTAPGPLAAVGASAKLVTLANWLRWYDRPVGWVTDTTPAKQGRFVPGTAIPIVAPDQQPDQPATILLGAWSYLPNMLRKEPSMFDVAGHIAGGGRLLLPVPVPTLI